MSTIEKMSNFTAAVYYYQKTWSTKEREILYCYHECENAFDVFAIKTEFKNGSTVGHLPREVSRITKFMLDLRAKVLATIKSTNCRCSPLVQGGEMFNSGSRRAKLL